MEEERSGIAKWLLMGLAIFLLVQYGWPLISGGGSAPKQQPLPAAEAQKEPTPEALRPEEKTCTLGSARSKVEFSSRGGALRSAQMLDPQYAVSLDRPDARIELVSTSREERMPLRADLSAPDADADSQQVASGLQDYELLASDDASCTFVHKSDSVEITRVLRQSARPFEIAVDVTVKNLAATPKKHRFAIEHTSWRTRAETEASFWDLGKRPEWMSDVVTHTSKKTTRHLQTDFEPDDFDDEQFTKERWLRAEGDGVWAAVSTSYFANAIVHRAGPAAPAAETLIEDGAYFGVSAADPRYGHLFRARLAYPEQELAPGAEAHYALVSYVGPKERSALAAIGGGTADQFRTTELIDLGMFGAIGKILLSFVYWLHGIVGSWGWTICLLTVSVKFLVFPLQLPSLRTGFAMRRLKPEVDAISAKYPDDMMQKNLAMQELYRREGVRPMIGCLPMLLQMPVWISLYQALLTSVELYHAPFGPLIPDLSHADPYHVIPIVLGASSFIQQRIVPAQGMDPAQQKMMLYMMPAIFTAMMFFLPAGLGVYMLTNTWLGIGQQLAVEKYMRSKLKIPATIEVREVKKSDEGGSLSGSGKGKVRARG